MTWVTRVRQGDKGDLDDQGDQGDFNDLGDLGIISCISGHLTEPLPFGDVVEDSLPITSWISKAFLQ